MWSLDVDNIPHPHLSLEASDIVQSSRGHSPTDNSGSSTAVEGEDFCQQHNHYFFADDNVIFQVENTRYKIHRYFFQRDSEIFASIFALPTGPGQGASEYNTIRLVGVKVRDFDLFLSMLYPAQIGVYSATTAEEWTSVLDLAAKWKFESIRSFAIKQLASLASPIDRIVLGRRHNILNWLTDAYRAVCERPDALTLEEAKLLGMEDVVRISSLRQDIRKGFRVVELSVDVLRKTFGLESPSELSPARQSDKEKEEVGSSCSFGDVLSECTNTWDLTVECAVLDGRTPEEAPHDATPTLYPEESGNEFEPTAVVQPKAEPLFSWTNTASPSVFGASEPNLWRASSGIGSKGKKGRRY